MNNDKIAILIKKANLDFDRISNQILAPYELTHTQFKTMMFLYKTSEAVRQIDIEKYFSMTNPTVTGILQNLEKKGMVARVANPLDSRSKVVVLTEQASAMREELLSVADSLERELTKNLTTAEQDRLAALLKKMLEED